MNPRLLLRAVLWANVIMATVAQFSSLQAYAQSNLGELRGQTRDPSGLLPLAKAQVWVHSIDEGGDQLAVSAVNGTFVIAGLKPGRYRLSATKEGFAKSTPTTFDLAAGQCLSVDVSLGQQAPASPVSRKTASGRLPS
jgi:hypothetical protein